MKIFQYYKNQQVKLGLYFDEKYIDVEETVKENRSSLPTTMEELINNNNKIAYLTEKYSELKPVLLKQNEILYAPVITKPEKILCVGLNYQNHINESGVNVNSDFPPVFSKFGNSLLGHNQPLHLPKMAFMFDYEAELVIVMGKEAHCVSKETALSYVFGYTVGNDFSARDLQMETSQWTIGKACDEFAPIGPYIVTADTCNPDHLNISCSVNGEIRQDSNTKYMIFSCADIISYISSYITLQPGDVIYTGTPEGVIIGKQKENQVWLKSGDNVSVTIEGLGTLYNELI